MTSPLPLPPTARGLRVSRNQPLSFTSALTGDILRDRLSKEGVVTVTGLLSAEEIALGLDGFTEDACRLVAAVDLRGKAKKPWTIPPPTSSHYSSLWKGHGAAFTRNAQLRRLNANVRKVYALLYGIAPHELIQSGDGYAFRYASWDTPPKNMEKKIRDGSRYWEKVMEITEGSSLPLHQDMVANGHAGPLMQKNMRESNFFPHCVQGALVFRDETATKGTHGTLLTAGFVGCPGPPEPVHLSDDSYDFYPLQEKDFDGVDHGDVLDRLRFFPAPAGALRLWRSDVIHGNTLSHPDAVRDLPSSSITRATQFICWGPRVATTGEDTRQKIEIAEKGGSHNHWPTVAMFGGAGSADPRNWKGNVSDKLIPAQRQALGED